MHLDVHKLKGIARKRGMTLSAALARAQVSRTAYYSLARKDNILPKSMQSLAKILGVRPGAFLSEETPAGRRMRRVYTALEKILVKHPGANRDNVLHTLLLLQEKPIDRLRRSLTRGRHHIYRKRDPISAYAR